jgi:hypothetical protein
MVRIWGVRENGVCHVHVELFLDRSICITSNSDISQYDRILASFLVCAIGETGTSSYDVSCWSNHKIDHFQEYLPIPLAHRPFANSFRPRLALPKPLTSTATSPPNLNGQPHQANHMPRNSTTISPLTTFLALCFFTLAFFPTLFHRIIWSPYNYAFPPSESQPATSVWCTTPNVCTPPNPPTMSW